MKKILIIFLISTIILIIISGVIYAVGFKNIKNYISFVDNQTDDTKILCEDTDNGKDIYTKGTVNLTEPLNIKEGNILKVMSDNSAFLNFGEEKEIRLGESQKFDIADQVYYLKADNTNGSLMINIPSTISIKKINFVSDKNTNNSVEAQKSSVNIDQCIGNVLIENTCERGINNGYVCEKGCNDGACIK